MSNFSDLFLSDPNYIADRDSLLEHDENLKLKASVDTTNNSGVYGTYGRPYNLPFTIGYGYDISQQTGAQIIKDFTTAGIFTQSTIGPNGKYANLYQTLLAQVKVKVNNKYKIVGVNNSNTQFKLAFGTNGLSGTDALNLLHAAINSQFEGRVPSGYPSGNNTLHLFLLATVYQGGFNKNERTDINTDNITDFLKNVLFYANTSNHSKYNQGVENRRIYDLTTALELTPQYAADNTTVTGINFENNVLAGLDVAQAISQNYSAILSHIASYTLTKYGNPANLTTLLTNTLSNAEKTLISNGYYVSQQNDTWASIAALVNLNNGVGIDDKTLQAINSALPGNINITTSSLIYVPISESVGPFSIPSLPRNPNTAYVSNTAYAYVYDLQNLTEYVVGSTPVNSTNTTSNAGQSYIIGDPSKDTFDTKKNQTLNVTAAEGLLANFQQSSDTTPTSTLPNTVTAAASVIANTSSDPSETNEDPFTADLVSGPSNGTLTLNPDGSFSYTPNSNYIGTDSFTYEVQDGSQTSDPSTVTINTGGGMIDLAFVIDTTGSTEPYIASFKAEAENILNSLQSSGADYRIAVVDYKDFPQGPGEPGDYVYKPDLAFSSDPTAISNAIDNLGPSEGGGDTPEAAYSALIDTIDADDLGAWRSGVQKDIVIMTDAPPHDPEPYTGYTEDSVIQAANDADPIAIYSIVPGVNNNSYTAQAYQIFSNISAQTGGTFFATPTSSDIENALLNSTSQIITPPITSPHNNIVNSGFGSQHWITASTAFPYTINFSNNAAQGTNPVAQVTITQTLDPSLNLSTFQLGNFSFEGNTYNVSQGLQNYSQKIDLTSTQGILVNVTAGLDTSTRTITWTFTSIDPTTGQPVTDPTKGFLPPNDQSGAGMGYVSYTIQTNTNVADSTLINAQATINFDSQTPIQTPSVFDTVEKNPPSSSVNALPTTETNPNFTVSWAGNSTDSGIAYYDIYVSTDGGDYTLWQNQTTTTSATYNGQAGSTYAFYSVATDNAGLTEAAHTQADTTTTVLTLPTSSVDPLPTTENNPDFTVSWTGSDPNSTIAYYDIYVSTDGGDYTLWQNQTTTTSATYNGQAGSTYEFYSVATDDAGLTQAAYTQADARTTVVTPFTSSVNPLPTTENDPNFLVSWTGSDLYSTIDYYDIYVSTNGGTYTLWQNNTTATSATYNGQAGDTYSFYSTATDDAGLTEATHNTFDTETTVISNVTSPNQPTFTQVGNSDVFQTTSSNATPVLLLATITDFNSQSVDELGVFNVDASGNVIDASGNVVAAPGATNYTQAALQNGHIVLSALANSPNGYSNSDINSYLQFPSGANLRFYLVPNSTTNNVLAGNTPTSDVLFLNSANQQIQASGTNSYNLNWNDSSTGSPQNLVVNVQSTSGTIPLGANLQVSKGLDVLDLTGVSPSQQVTASFTLNREAAYDNFGGLYTVDQSGDVIAKDGSIAAYNPSTGKSTYAQYDQAAVSNMVQGINLVVGNQQTIQFNSTLTGGAIYAPFLIQNDTNPTDVDGTNSAPQVFFPFIGANSDNFDHVRLLGNNIFGFEDQIGGGDKDYNDLIIHINLTTNNFAA